jgi:hypothetical protein
MDDFAVNEAGSWPWQSSGGSKRCLITPDHPAAAEAALGG